jgi:phage tail-like protein
MVEHDLPVAFYFRVNFGGTGADTSFQEVSGLTTEMDMEEINEGGNNDYTLKLPKGLKHGNLEMKRGLAPNTSELYQWCKKTLEHPLETRIATKVVTVTLMDAKGGPLSIWAFKDAYPISWEIEPFNATKNEVAIEKIVLYYSSVERDRPEAAK